MDMDNTIRELSPGSLHMCYYDTNVNSPPSILSMKYVKSDE